MKLSSDKARRLNRLVWRQRARRWLPVAAALLVLFGLLLFMFEWQISHIDRTVDVQMHDATVLSAKRTASRGMRVHLDDGHDVDAASRLQLTPTPGTHVEVSEVRHASGRLTWNVVRVADR